MTEWRTITEYPEFELSNEGVVRRIDTQKERKWVRNGYRVSMNFRGGRKENGGRKVTKSELMRTYWKYDFIKYLDDDEEAKQVKGFPNYFITSKGRVWNHQEQKFQTISKANSYYHSVSLTESKVKHTFKIHTLVGRNFIPEYEEGLHILHKQEEMCYPDIHFVDNLWVGSVSDNAQDRENKHRGRW